MTVYVHQDSPSFLIVQNHHLGANLPMGLGAGSWEHMAPSRATEGSTTVSQEAEGEGDLWREPLPWFPQEGNSEQALLPGPGNPRDHRGWQHGAQSQVGAGI